MKSRNINNSPFRSSGGTRFTRQLFWDFVSVLPVDTRVNGVCRYTLHHDHPNYINFRKEYLKDNDRTGYKTATRLLENYDHWLIMMKTQWFREAKAIWDIELDAKLEARATDVLLEMALDDDLKPSERLTAAKAILGRVDKERASTGLKRGRPSKQEIEGNLKEESRELSLVNEDLRRINGKQE